MKQVVDTCAQIVEIHGMMMCLHLERVEKREETPPEITRTLNEARQAYSDLISPSVPRSPRTIFKFARRKRTAANVLYLPQVFR